MKKQVRLKQSFHAVDEKGKKHSLRVLAEVELVQTYQAAPAELEGRTWIETNDGKPVVYLDKGKYRILGKGIILTSNDPKAP